MLSYKDGRFWKAGSPFFLIAAEYQYYRDRRQNWDDRLAKLKASGLNTISFYIPWRHHLQVEEGRRCYDFTGATRDNRDVAGFMERIRALGLFMIAKPGPFVHSELNIGGLPDIASPSFNPEMPPARRHNGEPATWSYDDSVLPAPLDPGFDALAKEWLEAVREVLRPFAGGSGSLIAIQLNDETIFCTSNDPPWHFGYDEAGLDFYRRILEERYGDIASYNRLHGTSYESFPVVTAPALVPRLASGRERQEWAYIDWAEYQWRLRRDLYLRYKTYLGIDLPYLTNFAGITPPIVENIPGKEGLDAEAAQAVPTAYAKLYPEWWFAMNRIDSDADAYHYGMISWLGVAAYDRDVFDRYINTARRARGINMEENWGFGTLYDARSRHPVVPFFQTLASVAGGATGYVIFVGAGTSYWDESLDRITQKQCRAYPSHAPIDPEGGLTPMYFTARMLNRWFAVNGEALLRCELEVDAVYLLYAPYAAVSSWVPDERYWGVVGHRIPRCGREGFEEFSRSLQEAGYSFAMFELEAAAPERLREPLALAIHAAFFMDAPEQEKLAAFIEGGGRLFISGELPEVDLRWRPCTRLKAAVETALRDGNCNVLHRAENLFAGGDFAAVLSEAGLRPRVRYSNGLRAYVYRRCEGGEEEFFVFFFNLDAGGLRDGWVEFYGQRLDMHLGPKTCGVLRIRDGRLVSYLVKGENEVEGVKARVKIRLGPDGVEGCGDFSSSQGDSACDASR